MDPKERQAHLRRLGFLKIQAAEQGYHTPPHILAEIEDIQRLLGIDSSSSRSADEGVNAERVPIAPEHIREISVLLTKIHTKAVLLVECLVLGLLLARRIASEELEEFCYHELVGWSGVDRDKVPPYRAIPGYFEPLGFIRRFFSNPPRNPSCELLIKEPMPEVEKNIAVVVGQVLSSFFGMKALASGEDFMRVDRQWDDVSTHHTIDRSAVRVYAKLSDYEIIRGAAREYLNVLLLQILHR